MSDPNNVVSFQGELGAYSHMACRAKLPTMDVMPCPSFEDALAAVREGEARLAMIPIENSTAGRVADIHILLPGSELKIIDEHFESIRHCLLAGKNTAAENLKSVISHVQALGQTRKYLRAHDITPVPFADTAGSAHEVSRRGDPTLGAVASRLAADVYDLQILEADIQDMENNTTRFVVLSKNALTPSEVSALDGAAMTSFTFEVKNLPAALYKALGGFATNGVNMTKLESYYESDSFTATEFYAEIVGTPTDDNVARAFEELQIFSRRLTILGTYPQAQARA
ncbi:prephenate dehydratase [Temperatibacter marinus]|uniref:prephenate dehydratase n=1 Tax=Temperatibacter marinus TaxID=1456591 RepID=A0AA52EJA4_9PROT|nr:prephenate dehydratase [Temperatibacter marinus]WND03314.1 prephenate dehydratase [Temperatibacter marinus]